MAVGATQLFDQGPQQILLDANPQWDTAGNNFSWILVGSAYTPNDAHTTVADINSGNSGGGTGTQVNAGTHSWINTGNGGPLALDTPSVALTSTNTELKALDANFGASVTIPGVSFLVLVMAATGSVVSGTKLILWIDLDTGGGNVSASAGPFNVQAPTSNVWFRINKQA